MRKNRQLVIIGKRIRSLRESAGYTQEDFALVLGLDRSYYGAIERGESNATVLKLVAIAEALGVTVGDLVPAAVYRAGRRVVR